MVCSYGAQGNKSAFAAYLIKAASNIQHKPFRFNFPAVPVGESFILSRSFWYAKSAGFIGHNYRSIINSISFFKGT
ncbi:hypothetical protein D3C73_1229020 [compost metagenome]